MNNLPFMHPDEARFVVDIIRGKENVFEWGSGGSTLFFSKFCDNYYSVEHNEEWKEKIEERVKVENLSNVNLQFCPPTQKYERPRGWREDPNYAGTPPELFMDYISAIQNAGKLFDVVLVDGRCRVQTATRALQFLKDEGTLLFHDFYPRRKFGYHDVNFYYEHLGGVNWTTQTIAAFKKLPEYTLENFPEELKSTDGVINDINRRRSE